ncbi:hypothetical protein ACFC14_18175 [Microbacterium sp. NPDC055988]|uniref:hypothetical protein n=1 Tax=Microbacterium sp. NPDC055988 TaxID=3345671 RepID=UPI0035D5BC95
MGRRDAISAVFAWVFIVGFVIALCAVTFGIRLAITGGDVGCVFVTDPALCVVVKGADQ